MNKIAVFIIILVLVGAGSFYGGMKYAQSGNSGRGGAANFSSAERERFQRMNGSAPSGSFQRGQNFSGMLGGEILSLDDKSLTIKLRDGGSKIIFFSTSTSILKSASSSITDLKAGEFVSVSGNANPDGSITAESISSSFGFWPSN